MNSLAIKGGAMISARHFDPPMIPIWVALLETAPPTTDDTVWITSGSDSHTQGLHPQCRALDVRVYNLVAKDRGERSEIASAWREKLMKRLGPNYDVLLEDDHIHIEYDPKGEF